MDRIEALLKKNDKNEDMNKRGLEIAKVALQDKMRMESSSINSRITPVNPNILITEGQSTTEIRRLAKNVKIIKDGIHCVIVNPNGTIKSGRIVNDFFDRQFCGNAYSTVQTYGDDFGYPSMTINYSYIDGKSKMKKNKNGTILLNIPVNGPIIIWSDEVNIECKVIESILSNY